MLLFALLLLTAQIAQTPTPAAQLLTRVYPVCAGVRVLAPNLATQPRDLIFSGRQILDLQFQACLRQDLPGDHVMQFKVLTPGGFLYRVLTVPFVGTAAGPPPPRAVPGYPRPLPVQTLVPTAGDSRMRAFYSVSTALPVAGTSITLSSLYGPWTVQAFLDGQSDPCGPATRFTIRD